MAIRIKRDIFTGEVVEEQYDPSPTGRTILAREDTSRLVSRHTRQSAYRVDKPHISRSLGIPPQQADRHNKHLQSLGITEAHYSDKTGFLESTDREHKAAAWAARGYFDRQGGAVEDRYAAAIGF